MRGSGGVSGRRAGIGSNSGNDGDGACAARERWVSHASGGFVSSDGVGCRGGLDFGGQVEREIDVWVRRVFEGYGNLINFCL